MFSGGLGAIEDAHVKKEEPEKGTKRVCVCAWIGEGVLTHASVVLTHASVVLTQVWRW